MGIQFNLPHLMAKLLSIRVCVRVWESMCVCVCLFISFKSHTQSHAHTRGTQAHIEHPFGAR